MRVNLEKMEPRPVFLSSFFFFRIDCSAKRRSITEKVHTSLAAYNAARCTFATRINIYLHEACARARAHTRARARTHVGACTRAIVAPRARYPHSTAHTRVCTIPERSEWLTSGNRRAEEISARLAQVEDQVGSSSPGTDSPHWAPRKHLERLTRRFVERAGAPEGVHWSRTVWCTSASWTTRGVVAARRSSHWYPRRCADAVAMRLGRFWLSREVIDDRQLKSPQDTMYPDWYGM